VRTKILHIITGLGNGGAENVLTQLCIHSTKVDHVVVSMMDAGKYGGILEGADIQVHCLGMRRGSFSVLAFLRLMRIIRLEQPDIVQTWMYHANLIGGLAARIVGVKRIFWGLRTTLDIRSSKKTTILISKITSLLSSWLPEMIICCAYDVSESHKKIGYDETKMVVINNGVDLTRFYPDNQSGKQLREKLRISRHCFLIGMVARADPQKNHEAFFQSIKNLNAVSGDFLCLLVGKGLTDDNSYYVNHLKKMGLTDKFILYGESADVLSIMNAIDLHVLSSFSEGFPNVIAEAMACGTACVSTNVGDAATIIGNENYCCESDDPEALSVLIKSMMALSSREPQEWHRLSISNRQRVETYFSLEVMVRNFESAWLHSEKTA